MSRKISRRILDLKMKSPSVNLICVRQLIVISLAVQCALALRVIAANATDISEDSSLQGDLIEPIGKTPVNTTPAPTNTIQSGDVVGFDQLAGFKVTLNNELLFNTNRPAWADQQISAMIPDRIRAADGKLINVDGFMIPLEYNGKKVSKFILAMNQNTCCFGGNPQIHEFIIVSVAGAGVNDEMDIPLRVKGVLHVAVVRNRGKLSGIYRLDAQSVTYAPAG
jgi:hypothetical protein